MSGIDILKDGDGGGDIDRIISGYAEEREDLDMDWSEYVCYILEVDKEDVNHDELIQLSAVLSWVVNSAVARDADQS